MPARRRQRKNLRARVKRPIKLKVETDDPSPIPRTEEQAGRQLGWMGNLAEQLLLDANPDLHQKLTKERRINRRLWLRQERAADQLIAALQAGLPWPQAVEQAVELELAPEPPSPPAIDLHETI